MVVRKEAPSKAPTTAAGRLDDQLCFALYAATNAITRAYRPMLTTMGITYPQYLLLLVLWETGARRLGQIAEDLRLASHAVSPIVDRLETAGLVRRMTDPDDGRVVIVELTEAGTSLEAAAAEAQDALRCRIELAEDEIVQLRDQLIALAGRVDSD